MSFLYNHLANLTNNSKCAVVEKSTIKRTTTANRDNKEAGADKAPGLFPRFNDKTIHDYHLIRLIGKGSFAKVAIVQDLSSKKPFAMKIMSKEHIYAKKMSDNIKTEFSLLAKLKHPFIVNVQSTFETSKKLCMALEFCPGGELFYHMKAHKNFSVDWARFYFAEVAQAYKYLHSNGICFRDIKPENILMDANGHLKLSDFGLVKEGVTDWCQGGTTMCGTPQYMAPEAFLFRKYGVGCDWWGLGVIMFEMVAGGAPFQGRNTKELFDAVRKQPLGLLRSWSEDLKDFFRGILYKLPAERLGSKGGADEILSHPLMSVLDMQAIADRAIEPPIVPAPVCIETVKAATRQIKLSKALGSGSGSQSVLSGLGSVATDAHGSAFGSTAVGSGVPPFPVSTMSDLGMNIDGRIISHRDADNFDSLYEPDELIRKGTRCGDRMGVLADIADVIQKKETAVAAEVRSKKTNPDGSMLVVCNKRNHFTKRISQKIGRKRNAKLL